MYTWIIHAWIHTYINTHTQVHTYLQTYKFPPLPSRTPSPHPHIPAAESMKEVTACFAGERAVASRGSILGSGFPLLPHLTIVPLRPSFSSGAGEKARCAHPNNFASGDDCFANGDAIAVLFRALCSSILGAPSTRSAAHALASLHLDWCRAPLELCLLRTAGAKSTARFGRHASTHTPSNHFTHAIDHPVLKGCNSWKWTMTPKKKGSTVFRKCGEGSLVQQFDYERILPSLNKKAV
jgi:hypothetical protein